MVDTLQEVMEVQTGLMVVVLIPELVKALPLKNLVNPRALFMPVGEVLVVILGVVIALVVLEALAVEVMVALRPLLVLLVLLIPVAAEAVQEATLQPLMLGLVLGMAVLVAPVLLL
jgi:hypothetical protein